MPFIKVNSINYNTPQIINLTKVTLVEKSSEGNATIHLAMGKVLTEETFEEVERAISLALSNKSIIVAKGITKHRDAGITVE